MERHYSKDSLSELAGGDLDFMKVVAQTFLEEIPVDLQGLIEAIENNNKELTYQYAHKMKPNLEMFGIDILKEIKAIESWTNTTKKVEDINPQIEKVYATLTAVFEELKEDFTL
jgi:HPt (histidine-containing phosphotransfer) domain-containing protein